MSVIKLRNGLELHNDNPRSVYVRGRMIDTPRGPVRAWVVMESPIDDKSTVSGHEVGFLSALAGLAAPLAGKALGAIAANAPAIFKGATKAAGAIARKVLGEGGAKAAGNLVKSAARLIPGASTVVDAIDKGDLSGAIKGAMALGIPGASRIAAGLASGQLSPAAAKAALASPAMANAAGLAASMQSVPAGHKPRIVRHIPMKSRIPAGYREVRPVAPQADAAGFVD